MEIKSPLTNSRNICILKTLSTDDVIDSYKSSFNIDVSKYFLGIHELYLCLDLDSDYIFFYPEIVTDSHFYELFQKFDWYYMDWKWEFQEVLKSININEKILEIGCGKGDFLLNLRQKGNKVVGLEFNKQSVSDLKSSGLEVYNTSVEEFSMKNQEEFDVVVSFQVLEHIYNVNEFLASSLKLLKKNGRLIISVPNNDSFIKYSYPSPLNLPPHHAGWWNKKNLSSLENTLGVKLQKLIYEPLQEYHFDWYYNLTKTYLIKKYGSFVKLFFYPFRNRRYRKILKISQKHIKGLTIISIYQKQ